MSPDEREKLLLLVYEMRNAADLAACDRDRPVTSFDARHWANELEAISASGFVPEETDR